jgi:hypothetical protein
MLKLSLEEGRRLTYNNESNRRSREERLKELDKE